MATAMDLYNWLAQLGSSRDTSVQGTVPLTPVLQSSAAPSSSTPDVGVQGTVQATPQISPAVALQNMLADRMAAQRSPDTIQQGTMSPTPTVSATGPMQQFLANRAGAVQGPDTSPSPQMSPTPDQYPDAQLQATTKYPREQLTLENAETGQTLYKGYSTSGPKTEAQWDKAIAQFDKSGKAPSGFTFLKPDSLQRAARDTYSKYIGQPAAAVAGAIDKVPRLQDKYLGGFDPGVRGVNQTLDMASGIIKGVDTPEGGGAMLASALAAYASGGLSEIPKAAVLGTAYATGALGGDVATGSQLGNVGKRTTDFFWNAVTATGVQGLLGGLKVALGMGMSDVAKGNVAKDMVTHIKDTARPLVSDPTYLNAYASTKPGADKLINSTISGLRGDIDTLSNTFIADFQAAAPRALPSGTVTTLRAQLRRLNEAGNSILDNTGDFRKNQATMQTIATLQKDIVATITQGFASGKSPITLSPAQTARITGLLKDQSDGLAKFMDTANLLRLMKESVTDRGFDATLFKQKVTAAMQSSAPFTKARQIADKQVGEPVTLGVPIGKMPPLSKIPLVNKLSVPLVTGTKYPGGVPGTYPTTTGTAGAATVIPTIEDNIKEYMRGE